MRKKRETRLRRKLRLPRLVAVTAGDARSKMEGDLARVKDALTAAEEASAIAKEARRKAEYEAT